MIVKLFKTSPHAFTRPRPGDVGYDLRAHLPEQVCIPAWKSARIPTGVHIEFVEDYYGEACFFGKIEERSSLGERLRVCGGIIDPAYRGEIVVMLQNMTDDDLHIDDGAKIAQLIFYRSAQPTVEFVDSLDKLTTSMRGQDGWGSTDKPNAMAKTG